MFHVLSRKPVRICFYNLYNYLYILDEFYDTQAVITLFFNIVDKIGNSWGDPQSYHWRRFPSWFCSAWTRAPPGWKGRADAGLEVQPPGDGVGEAEIKASRRGAHKAAALTGGGNAHVGRLQWVQNLPFLRREASGEGLSWGGPGSHGAWSCRDY